MLALGNIAVGATIDFDFNTHKADGTPITLTGTPVVKVYKGDATGSEVTTGVTLTVDHDSTTGKHHVNIVASDAFYAAGSDYSVVLTAGTVDGTSVAGTVLAHFAIRHREALASVGTGTGQVQVTSGVMQANTVQLAGNAYAVATTTGNWGDNATWAAGAPPIPGQHIIVNTGVTVTIAADLDLGTFGTLILAGTGAIAIAANKTVAKVPLGWTIARNDGTVTGNYGRIILNAATITANRESGEVVVNSSGTIGSNFGLVVLDYGTVSSNLGVILYGTGGQASLKGDKMDIIDAPNSTAVGVIQAGLALTGEAATAVGTIAGDVSTAATQATNAASDASTAKTQTTAANIGAAVWGYTTAAMDALGATTVGKWLRTLLGGITVLANWLRAGYRKSTPDATALSEINLGGGTYSAPDDSMEAQSDRLVSASAMVARTPNRANPPGQVYTPGGSSDTKGVVVTNGTVTLMRRVTDYAGANITQASVTSASYSVYKISNDDSMLWTVVDGHDDVALTISNIIYDTLQTGAPWDVDTIGYNFKHTPPIVSSAAFADLEHVYVVEYTLNTSGQPIVVRFKVSAV